MVAEHRGGYRLLTAAGERRGELLGRLRRETRLARDRPAVGDWVAVQTSTGNAALTIVHAVLPRTSLLSRARPGGDGTEQAVAANVDVLFLVTGLDANFNLRRIERAVVLAHESGARPVVVLSKSDLTLGAETQVAAAEGVAPGVPVHAVSAVTGEGLGALDPYLVRGCTVALVGSSGVGKSTLLNRLHGSELHATAAVRESDSRGRHTTTHRSLVLLPSGVLLLDTPGMRELQLWADEAALDRAFPEMAEAATQCRFRDCRHLHEPGCGVRAAAAEGDIDGSRLAAHEKMLREVRHLEQQKDERAREEAERQTRALHRAARRHKPRRD